MQLGTLTRPSAGRQRSRLTSLRWLPPRLVALLRSTRRYATYRWRSMPGPIRRPMEDAVRRLLLRTGRGEVVPAEAFERFLVANLPRVRVDGGMYVEFGVYLGTSLAAAVRAFDRSGCTDARFVGFDSFAGLPPGSEAEGWTTGAFAASRRVTEWHLRRLGVLDRAELVEGWFEETCNEATARDLGMGNVVVAMVDCDIYSASATALAFVEPLLAERSLLIFDDWFARNPSGELDEGQRKAFRELLAARPGHRYVELGPVGFHGLAFLLEKGPARTEGRLDGAAQGSSARRA